MLNNIFSIKLKNKITDMEIEEIKIIMEEIIKKAYEKNTNETLKSKIYKNLSNMFPLLIEYIKNIPMETIKNNDINYYILKIIFKYQNKEVIKEILEKNNSIKEYYNNEFLINYIKKEN